MENILVIKHGALGDIILSTASFKAIRNQHENAHITLLTTKPYKKLLEASPYFDKITIDERPKPWKLKKIFALRKFLRSQNWNFVYDLQTSCRSTSYYKLFNSPKPKYSGLAKGGSHRHDTAHRSKLHTIDRQREQMEIAGIGELFAPDISWLKADVSEFNLDEKFAILVAGGAPHRPEKRLPEKRYIELAGELIAKGYKVVLLGTNAEAEILQEIEAGLPSGKVVNLCNQTSIQQIASIARKAEFAIGNDTGPMHIIAATGLKCVILFSHASNPKLCAPRGDNISILRKENMDEITVAEICESLRLSTGEKAA